jgi:hypothetical protein
MSMVLRLSAPPILFAWCVLNLASVAAQGGATAVSGTVAVNKTTIALKHGRAYGFDSVTAAGKNIALLLADRPIDEAPLREQLKIFEGARVVPGAFTGAWAGMFLEKELQGIAFTWGADKKLMLNDIYADGQDSQFGLPDDSYVVTLKELSEKRVSGTIKTVKPRLVVGSDGLAVSVDVTFDVPVGPLPK